MRTFHNSRRVVFQRKNSNLSATMDSDLCKASEIVDVFVKTVLNKPLLRIAIAYVAQG